MDEIPVNNTLYAWQAIQSNAIMSMALSPNDFIQIQRLLDQGGVFMSQGDFQQAIDCFDQGIEQLGHRYLSHQIDDDTDIKLMLGNIEQQQDHLERAAHLKCNVLASRIQVYEALYLQREE